MILHFVLQLMLKHGRLVHRLSHNGQEMEKKHKTHVHNLPQKETSEKIKRFMTEYCLLTEFKSSS